MRILPGLSSILLLAPQKQLPPTNNKKKAKIFCSDLFIMTFKIDTTEWLINPVSSWDSSIDYSKCPWLTFYIVSFSRCCKAENHIFMIFKGWMTSLDNLCYPWKPNDVSYGVYFFSDEIFLNFCRCFNEILLLTMLFITYLSFDNWFC